ncbi:ECF transporter S component [Anaerofustis sp.]|uniref:ECF transporter S component n=1 Tax=Anaerofustis sp. TaxID=1872517 RepID=UPI0025BE606E|nr:ECF transporter S component [Anaerofustis sp.]
MKDTRRLVTLSMLIALSIVLMLIVRFPIMPSAAWLEYEPMDIPLLIAGLQFGPVVGIIAVVISSCIQAMTVSAMNGWVGALMHIISSSALVGVTAYVYGKNKTKKGAMIGLILGALSMVLIMIPANLIITTNFYGMPLEAVKASLPVAVIPFNLLKAGINCLVTFIIYKPISNFIHKEPDRKSVKVTK